MVKYKTYAPEQGKLLPKAGILDISAYTPGKSQAPGTGRLIKLSSNETPLGPSTNAIEAYHDASAKLALYPDGSAKLLRETIAKRYDLNPIQIVCGAGSDELLNLLAAAYLGPEDEAIYTEHGFLVYKIAIMANGARPVVAPEINHTADINSILDKVTDRTRAVFLANPNNPTGTYCPVESLWRLREGLADHIMLVLDGAYAEYVMHADYNSGMDLVGQTGNTIMTRTFSKIYGLASLRLGWAYCPPDVADVLNRIRGPFNVSDPAIKAGIAAIEDEQHIQNAIEHNTKWRDWLSEKLTSIGLKVTPSVANFVLLHFPGHPDRNAVAADAFLMERRIILRRLEKYGLPNALRLSVGSQADNEAVVGALTKFMNKQ
ncbi:MAG: histidinol-phosphate transaminase [Pseudomonadota bacterium]